MFNPCPRLLNPVVAPLLSLGQWLVSMPFALDPVPITIRLQPGFPLPGGIAPVGVNIPAGVGRVHDGLDMLAVVDAGRISDDVADELVLLVHAHRELVAVVALAMFLRPRGIQVFLPPFGRLPVSWYGLLSELLLVILCEVLFRGWHQGGVDDLSSSRDEASPQELCGYAIEDGLGTGFADPILERPHSGPVGNVGDVGQTAEAFVAHSVQKLILHLLVGQVVEPLQDQNTNHCLGREWWTPSLCADRARGHDVDVCCQGRKVDTTFDLDQWVAQLVERLFVMLVSKQVGFDGGAFRHGGQVNSSG